MNYEDIKSAFSYNREHNAYDFDNETGEMILLTPKQTRELTKRGIRNIFYCEKHGHKYISENRITMDEGREYICCARCGQGWETIYY